MYSHVIKSKINTNKFNDLKSNLLEERVSQLEKEKSELRAELDVIKKQITEIQTQNSGDTPKRKRASKALSLNTEQISQLN